MADHTGQLLLPYWAQLHKAMYPRGNFMSSYAVYWSQLTGLSSVAYSQFNETNLAFALTHVELT